MKMCFTIYAPKNETYIYNIHIYYYIPQHISKLRQDRFSTADAIYINIAQNISRKLINEKIS